MQDRVANYPNRWKLTPVTGENDTYDFTRADDPVVAGTPLNKATFLTDATAALVGALSGNTPSLPDEAIAELATVISGLSPDDIIHFESGSYTGAGTHGQNNPNTLTFTFKPRIVFVWEQQTSNFTYTGWFNSSSNLNAWLYPQVGNYGASDATYTFSQPTDNSLSWYITTSTSGAARQKNYSGRTYYYWALGV